MLINIATLNIHACIGRDGCFDPDRIIALLHELNADIIALQEVEHHLIDDEDLLELLARKTGYQAIAGPTLMRDTRDYGNALLTRLPVLSSESRDISMDRREPRAVIEAWIKVDQHEMLVIATHLGLKPAERRHQVRQILSLLQSHQADITLMMGDLNEWFLWGRPLRWLHKFFHATPHLATFPAHFPMFSLDRIWINPQRCLRHFQVHKTELARMASDHLPLTALVDTSLF